MKRRGPKIAALFLDLLAEIMRAGSWSAPSSSAVVPDEDEHDLAYRRRKAAERLAEYSRWLIKMRWIVVVVALVVVVAAIHVFRFLPQAVLTPLVATIVALAAMNLLLTRAVARGWLLGLLLPGQMYADLIVLMVMLHFSGGIENPLWLLAVFHVVLAGMLLRKRAGYAVAVFAALSFACLGYLELSGAVEHYTLVVFPHYAAVGDAVHDTDARDTQSLRGHGADASGRPVGDVYDQTTHGHLTEELPHAVHDRKYVATCVTSFAVVLLITSYFVTTLAERVRVGEEQLERMAVRALAQRRLLERSLETTETALRVVDRHGNVLWMNERWRTWFADDETSEGGGESKARALSPRIAAVLEDARMRVSERVIGDRNATGTAGTRVFQISSAPLEQSGGRLEQVVELAQEVTEQRRLQAQLMHADKMAALGELAGQFAHEVNNPITIVSAKGRLLLETHAAEMSDHVRAEIAKMTDAANRIGRITRDLLAYGRPAAPSRQPLDLGRSVARAADLIRDRAESSGVTITLKTGDEPAVVDANEDELQQVFLNLLLNALDAMPGGGQLDVEVIREGSGTWIDVLVRDSGTGVPLEVRDRIFEPFVTTKTDGSGTGLGLSVCLGLVRSHGGEIGIVETSNRGTTFRVRLPVAGGRESDRTG